MTEFVVTSEQKFRNSWGMLVKEMNGQGSVSAGGVEKEDAPCKLCFALGDSGELDQACTPVAAYALSVVAPAIIAAEMRSSQANGLTVGLEPATIEAIARAGALRHTKWLDIASKRMAQSLTENPALSIEGFLRFRMRDLLDTLHNELVSLLGALNIEEEYRNFIRLLKRYAAFNRKETETLTVCFCQGGAYTLLTAGVRRLLSVPPLLDTHESGNMLITLLDSISPGRVVILGSAQLPESVRQTIRYSDPHTTVSEPPDSAIPSSIVFAATASAAAARM